MFHLTTATDSDYGDIGHFFNLVHKIDIETIHESVFIDAVDDKFADLAINHFIDKLLQRNIQIQFIVDFIAVWRRISVNRNRNALASEKRNRFFYKGFIGERLGFDYDFISPDFEQRIDIVNRFDSAANRNGHITFLDDIGDKLEVDFSFIRTRENIEENQFVNASIIVNPCSLDGITDHSWVCKILGFYQSETIKSKDWDNSDFKH